MTLAQDLARIGSGGLKVCRIPNKKIKWTANYRMRVARSNDNGGTWYLCDGTKSVQEIERRFMERSVASLLYKTVGGVLGDHRALRSGSVHYLFLQLKMKDQDVEQCLREGLGIRKIREPVHFAKIERY